jgi:hypothetical protein
VHRRASREAERRADAKEKLEGVPRVLFLREGWLRHPSICEYHPVKLIWHETGAVGVPGFIHVRAQPPNSVTWSYALRLAVSLREI